MNREKSSALPKMTRMAPESHSEAVTDEVAQSPPPPGAESGVTLPVTQALPRRPTDDDRARYGDTPAFRPEPEFDVIADPADAPTKRHERRPIRAPLLSLQPEPSLSQTLAQLGVADIIRAAIQYIHEVDYAKDNEWIAVEERLRQAVNALPGDVLKAVMGTWSQADLDRAEAYAERMKAMFEEGKRE